MVPFAIPFTPFVACLWALFALIAVFLYFIAIPAPAKKKVEKITPYECRTIESYLAWNKCFVEQKEYYDLSVLEAIQKNADYFLQRLRIMKLSDEQSAK